MNIEFPDERRKRKRSLCSSTSPQPSGLDRSRRRLNPTSEMGKESDDIEGVRGLPPSFPSPAEEISNFIAYISQLPEDTPSEGMDTSPEHIPSPSPTPLEELNAVISFMEDVPSPSPTNPIPEPEGINEFIRSFPALDLFPSPTTRKETLSALKEISEFLQFFHFSDGLSSIIDEDIHIENGGASAPENDHDSGSDDDYEPSVGAEANPINHPILAFPATLAPVSPNVANAPSAEDIDREIMSICEVWQPVLLSYESISPDTWMDYSVLNFVLMKYYYSLYPHASATYLDSYSLQLMEMDPESLWRVDTYAIPRFRKRAFLPINGPCPLQPKVFVVRKMNHFFTVYMDHEKRSVTVFGRTSSSGRDRWEEWDGPKLYRQICYLHGWTVGSLGDVKVQSVSWEMNGIDCGPVAILTVQYLLTDGFSKHAVRTLTSRAESCHHTTRMKIFSSLRTWISESIENYTYFRTDPPEAWLTFSVSDTQGEYPPLDSELWDKYKTLRYDRSDTCQTLNRHMSGCPRCMRIPRVTEPPTPQPQPPPPPTSSEDEVEERLHNRDEPTSLVNHSSFPVKPSASPPPHQIYESAGTVSVDQSRTRRLHIVKVNWDQRSIERRKRTAIPCDIPLPSGRLWPQHDLKYDDYFGGPTREDLRGFEDPIHAFSLYDPLLSSIFFKSPWAYLRDYGYRLMLRWPYSYYMCPPFLLECHVMPLVPEYNPETSIRYFHDMHSALRPIGRTGIPELRMVSSGDIELFGATEMLDSVQAPLNGGQDENMLLLYFVRGKTRSGNYICVDLERDAINLDDIEVKLSIDIDSFVWVTNLVKVSAPVGLMVTPCSRKNSGIQKHNHVYVEILEPPTDLEAKDCARRLWIERRVPLSHIPHTLFTRITEGNSPINCYIFFPRMMHRNEYTGKRVTYIPPEILVWFWDMVVLPSLRFAIDCTPREPFYEFSVKKYLQKRPGKTSAGNDTYHGLSKQVDPSTFLKLQQRMHHILETHLDTQQMDRFKSFFFVVECKGFKLNVISENNDSVMKNLRHNVPQMDWDYVIDRKNGEVHMDVGFTYHPRLLSADDNDTDKAGVTGLWRMGFLEESFSKAGFKAGTAHHLNTLAGFGAIQAEMSVERMRRTHILHRSAYNLVYEAVRKKDNDPWFCADGDAYNLTDTFLKACKEKCEQYSDRESRSYGVRDEYRVSGEAAVSILESAEDVLDRFKSSNGVLWIPTGLWFDFASARVKALQHATIQLDQKSPENKGTIVGVFMNLMRSIESTPMNVPAHVQHSLAALTTRATTATHGMMFLNDLNVTDNDAVTLPEVVQKDDPRIRAELEVIPRRKKRQFAERPCITEEYPLGQKPTWSQVQENLKTQPLLLIRSWERPTYLEHIYTFAGILFVDFTKSIWVSIRSNWTEGIETDFKEVTNLDHAMKLWTAENMVNSIKAVSFSINRYGIKGAVRGNQEAKSFRERSRIYFPEDDGVLPPRGSKWVPFFLEKVGYIRRFHVKMKSLGEEDKTKLRESLEDIFSHLQCLPASEAFTEKKEGTTWSKASGEEAVAILVNANHMRFREIGGAKRVREGPKRTHVTRSNKETISQLFKQKGIIEHEEQQQQRNFREERKKRNNKKSVASKNKRAPPKKRKKKEEEEEDEDVDEDEEGEETGNSD